MSYKPAPVPNGLSRVVAQYLREELRRIEIEFGSLAEKSPGVFQATGSTNISSTAATLGLDTEVADPNENYELASSEISVRQAGWYHVSVNIPIDDEGSAGGTRAKVFAYLERDQGTATFITVPQLRGQDYARELSGGEGVSFSGLVELAAGEAIRVRVDQSGTVDLQTESAEASLSIFNIKA